MTKLEKYEKAFPLPTLTHKQDIFNRMNQFVWEFITNKYNTDSVAYATRDGSATSSYKIFITPKAEGCEDALKIHEFGHCVFQHLKIEQIKKGQTQQQIKNNWEKFKPYIDFDSGEDEKAVLDNLIHMIQNYAMDMEVNSKVYEKLEVAKVFDAMQAIILGQHIASNDDELKDAAEKWIDDKIANKVDKPYVGFVNCTDYGFPVRLDWMAYVYLICSNPKKFMENMKKNAGTGAGSSGGSPLKQDGNGKSGKSNGKSSEKSGSDGKSGKVSASYIKGEAKDSDVESNKPGQSGDGSKSKNSGNDIGNSNDGFNSGDDESSGEDNGDTSSQNGRGDGHFLTETNLDFESLHFERGLKSFIQKNCIAEVKRISRTDPLYNYNRRKSGSVLIPKLIEHNSYRPGNIYVVVDVSSSVSIKLVKSIIELLQQLHSKFGPTSRIITWDTDLCSDCKLMTDIKKLHISGGGTSIAKGIKFANENYLNSTEDKLFIISDFEDNLDEWTEELKNVKGTVTAVRWSYNNNSYYESCIEDLKNIPNAVNIWKRLNTLVVNMQGDQNG